MKTIAIPAEQSAVAELCEQARDEDVLVRLADGREFLLAAIDDFDLEVARTRKNQSLMSLLEERARQTQTVSLAAVKQNLGLSPRTRT